MTAVASRYVSRHGGRSVRPLSVAAARARSARSSGRIQALEGKAAVFCQKPLGRDAAEVEAVLAAARSSGRLLGVDLSYRFTQGMRAVREQVRSGALGDVYAANLAFHNAYGPDKAWFYDPALSGGGCVIDLGIHLVDLALWTLDFPEVAGVSSRLYAKGRPLEPGQVEDYAEARLDLATGATIRIACSWHLPAGRDAVIAAEFYGTSGGAAFHNVGGSFYDFTAERFEGTHRVPLAGPPDDWGGRAAADWAEALARGETLSDNVIGIGETAAVLDRIYRDAAVG